MKKTFLAGIAIIFWYSEVIRAQIPNIKIDDHNNPEEVSVAINSSDPNNVVAGANILYAYYSLDGGKSWVKDSLHSSYGVWGDPCIASDADGNFYFIHLSWPSFGHFIDRIVVQKSEDRGQSWNEGSYFGLNGMKNQDKAWAVIDNHLKNIYITWTQFDKYGTTDPHDSSIILFTKSADGGTSWSKPMRISRKAGDCVDSDNTTEGAVPCIGLNGEIYVSWSNRDTIFFNRSTDEGKSWINDNVVVSDQPGGWDYNVSGIFRCNGMPITKCDISNSPYRGTIYVNWSDQRNGVDNTDVWISKSMDGGNTWSQPFRVNDDEGTHQQFMSWMDVDPKTGYIYIIYYDRRNYSSDSTDIYLAYSTDGGNSFQNEKLSDRSFLPNQAIFFGDYINIAAYNNFIVPIWMRMDGNFTSVYTAPFHINNVSAATPVRNNQSFVLYQNFPNPAKTITTIELDTKKEANYSLTVYDLTGHLITTIWNKELCPAGKHFVNLNVQNWNLQPGVYYYVLKHESEVATKKLMVIAP